MWVVILFFGLSVGTTLLYKYVPVPVSPLMIIRLFEQMKDGEDTRDILFNELFKFKLKRRFKEDKTRQYTK